MNMSTFTMIGADDPLMTGKEMYPIHGPLINEGILQNIYKDCAGLALHWNCIEKAQIVQRHIGGTVFVGKCYIISGDWKAEYGYEFNPPFEFHAWVCIETYGIVDVSLPGMILKGLEMSDELGPIIVKREPIVLAGPPENWIIYEPKAIYEKETETGLLHISPVKLSE